MSGQETPSVIGEYKIMRPVAKGLMGMVYVGTRGDDNVYHAIKVLNPSIAEELPWAMRFVRDIKDDLILDYKTIDVTAGDQQYLVTEYLELKPISRARIPGLRSSGIVEIFASLADTMHRIHGEGVSHGNIKASNVLVRRADSQNAPQVKLTDFGLTYKYDPSIINGSTVGKIFAYMSPERIQQVLSGLPSKDSLPTPAMDIYALGVTLCQVLTGELPYEDIESPQEILQKKEKRQYLVVGMTTPKSSVDLGKLNEVVSVSTAFNERERYRSMAEFAEALRDSIK